MFTLGIDDGTNAVRALVVRCADGAGLGSYDQCWLCQDHTSWREAAKITALAAQQRPQFIAQRKMTSLKKLADRPKPAAQKTYDQLYALYRQLHDSGGGLSKSADRSRVMKELLALKI